MPTRLGHDLDRIADRLWWQWLELRLKNREERMASLGSISDRIKAKKAAHQAKADEWAAELDHMDQLEPELFAAGDAAVAERAADMDELRANFEGLRSNLGPTSGG